jgi:hypothetical protein
MVVRPLAEKDTVSLAESILRSASLEPQGTFVAVGDEIDTGMEDNYVRQVHPATIPPT